MALFDEGAGALHHVPASGFDEECFCEFNGHPDEYAAGILRRSRTQRFPRPITMVQGRDEKRAGQARTLMTIFRTSADPLHS